MTGRELRQALHAGRNVYGSSILASMPMWPKAIAHAGLDFVFLDTEHVARDRVMLSWMCRAYAALGLPPLVRIPSPDPYLACVALDDGAVGLIAPYVETAAQVRALVGATKFRPLKGARLEAALDEPNTLEPELRTYVNARCADNVLIVNVESGPAIQNLDEILSVPGLDAVLIGPHDLSCNLGVPEDYRHPKFLNAVNSILTRARARGIGAGVHFWSGTDLEIAFAKAGGNLIIHSSDITLFSQALRAEVAQLCQALGDSRETGPGASEVIV